MLKWIFFPIGTAAVLCTAAISFGPALAAAGGHGTAGYFVAEAEHCDRGSCGWSGDFVTLDGRDTRRNVSYVGPHGTLYPGARLAALDTGGPSEVYPRHESRTWMVDLAGIVAAGLGLGLWAWLVPYQAARQRARRRESGDWPLSPH